MRTAIIRTLGVAALAACMASAAPLLAQTAEPAAVLPPSGIIPEAMLGAPCKAEPLMSSPQTQLMRVCFGTPITDKPSVSFMILTPDSPVSKDEHIRANRNALHERKLLEIKEQDFSPSTLPGSVGVKAYYNTDAGARIIWSVYHDGKWYKVILFAFSDFDAKAAQAEVEAKFFGIGK
jgi:hypothetical protein